MFSFVHHCAMLNVGSHGQIGFLPKIGEPEHYLLIPSENVISVTFFTVLSLALHVSPSVKTLEQ
jgi:hypothetical protein